MKIICTQENLKTGLLATSRVVSTSNTLPILSNLLIKTENGMLRISSTNLEIAITTLVRCKIEEDGGVTVSSKTINDLIGNLPNKNITLQTQEGVLSVEAENYHTTIKTLPVEDFPLIPTIEEKNKTNTDAQNLKKSLDQTVFATSLNQTQPEISGVLFSQENKQLRVVATDRYRLAEKIIELQKPNQNPSEVIVPQRTVVELGRVIGGQSGDVEVVIGENQIRFGFKDTQIISRLIDGQYPDYKQIIPTEFKTTCVVEKNELINALKTVGVFGQGSNSIKFLAKPKEGKVRLSAESSELGKSEVDLGAEAEGEDATLVLNHHYLLDCLSVLESQKVRIKIIDENSPTLMVAEGQTNYLYLVMPIKS